MGNPTNILDLPLEILDLVFNKLTFENKIKLGLADNKLGAAFAYHSRNEYKKISSCNLPLENWSDFLSICGSIVDEVDVSGLDVQYLKLIEQHCCNLKIISNLYVKDNKCSATKNLIRGVRNLTSLEITITNDATAEVVLALQELPNLKILNIQYLGEGQDDSSSGTLKHPSSLDLAEIHQLINLEELTIGATFSNMSLNIIDLPSKLKMLRSLNLNNLIISSPIEKVDFICPSLEELIINSSQIEFELPYCPKLRSLKILRSKYVSNNLKWLSEHTKTLETLQADGSIFQKNILSSIFLSNNFKTWEFPNIQKLYIHDSDIKFPLPFCPKLKSLELNSTCFFSMNFFFKWISKHGKTLQKLKIGIKLFKDNCRLTKLSKIQSQQWTLPALEDLKISFHLISYDLPYCPNLLYLNCEYAECHSMDYFYMWLLKHANNLQSIELTEELFEESEFLKFLSSCKQLKKFSIETKISYEFLNSFIKTLKKSGVSSKDPFEITVSPKEFPEIKRMIAELPNSEICKCLKRRNYFEDLEMDFSCDGPLEDLTKLILKTCQI